jgi:hypothetical protein
MTAGADPPGGAPGRSESAEEKYDRNYDELLQELRVAQAGVQILFAFLLSIAFQQRFSGISSVQRIIYVATLMFTAASAVALIAPVAIHRLVFRRHRKAALVTVSNVLAIAGLGTLMVSVIGVVWLILLEVTGLVLTVVLLALLTALFLACWVLVPLWLRRPPGK